MKLLGSLVLFVCFESWAVNESCEDSFDASGLAVIDMDEIFMQSSAGRSIQEQIEQININEKKDLIKLEEKIKQKDLKNRSPNEEEARKLEEMQVILYDMTRKKRYKIQQAYQNAIKLLEKCVQSCISKIAMKKKVKMVLPVTVFVYYTDNVQNITSEVLCAVNNEMPDIKVKLEESAE